jgi:uncharacterized protein (TIGR02118 family)
VVKLVYVITRKDGLAVEAFQRYWRETHGAIAARIPGVRRYVQSHVLPELYDQHQQPPYDGVAELWFDDMDALRAALRSPEVQEAQQDERNFIDHTRVALLITEENVVVP